MLTTPHGSDCRCEDCLGARITRTADIATVGRIILPLRARQLSFEARLAARAPRPASDVLEKVAVGAF
jgi:hypothetical protein